MSGLPEDARAPAGAADAAVPAASNIDTAPRMASAEQPQQNTRDVANVIASHLVVQWKAATQPTVRIDDTDRDLARRIAELLEKVRQDFTWLLQSSKLQINEAVALIALANARLSRKDAEIAELQRQLANLRKQEPAASQQSALALSPQGAERAADAAGSSTEPG